MSDRQETILRVLRANGKATAWTLAACIDAPEASVRRDIQVLRRNGYNISFAEGVGEYRYYGF